ncbi:uncharacterized protein MONBRDRAFT_26513 [Monosiga brevicollis MX1]|uniref:Reverse transcriptase domain-containing protein n=2 Tax=Monosiga brevicollis TaxID=81824 RepID=A9V2K8_MONBE|nr:uncharacterized protein MONBRDRAFT_26513 [Monosiga brevicollis MX1]EDQ88275.1 predicted protein [Monosiga brevicollis MX1]|eukprot:XP_001746868.1 hypothetical protein [Monosiga brevicollis MX1]
MSLVIKGLICMDSARHDLHSHEPGNPGPRSFAQVAAAMPAAATATSSAPMTEDLSASVPSEPNGSGEQQPSPESTGQTHHSIPNTPSDFLTMSSDESDSPPRSTALRAPTPIAPPAHDGAGDTNGSVTPEPLVQSPTPAQMVLPYPSGTQQTHSDPSPPSASPPASAILPAAVSHPVEHSEHANSAPLGEVSESETHNTASEHSESEQDVLLSDPAPSIAANVLDAQRKVLLKTSGHRQLLACPFGLCKCKGPRLDRKGWVNHVLREHPYDEQATDLVKQVMEAKLVAQCNKCHLFFEAAGISQHRSRCGANLKRATEALFHAAGHDLLEIMRGAWPQQCVGSRISARHPLMQRSRYPSNATETKLMAATLSQLYWSAVHSDYTAEEREMCWALILALPSMLLSAPSTALSTIDLRNMFHDRLRWLVTGQLGRVVDAMRKAVARKQSRQGQLNAGAGAHPNDAVDQSLRSLVRDPDLADEAWANHVTNRLNRGQIAKAFDADKARAVIGNSEVQAVRDLLVPPGLTPYIASTPASTSTLAPATAASSPNVSFTKGELPKALAATKGVTDPYGWSGELLASIYRIKEHFSQVLGPRQGSTSDPTAPSDGDAPQGPTTATGGPQVALNKIFHHIANNTVPESIRHALCSINYTILEKANGKFRPVGTDSIFNKVVNRALLEQQQPHIAHLLQASPELAVRVKDGISAAVGMAFGELQACESTPGWTMLSLDFKSAFNYTDRARLHEIVADKVPGLLRAFERHYARPTTHCIVDKFFKVIDIDVGQGIVQGNELSPFFFALYSCEVLGLLDATTDYRCKVIKYLDDIVLMGPAEDVAADVEIVKARAESAGLHLQPSKSRFYMPRHHPASIAAIESALPDAVRETANTGMTVLGTPIGRREWMKKQLNDKAKHIAGKLNDMLTTGVSLQALLTAMQYVPSLINHLYTLPPTEIIALRSKAALDDLMAKCALDLQQAYLASREWGVSTVLTMRGRDKLRRLSDTTFAIAVVSMMGFGLHELINVKPTDKCPLCSSKTPQPRLTREHLLTCRPIKRHNALRDEMGRLLRYATLSHVWVEKSGYNANGQSCRIDLHCRNPFPGGALGPALPDLGIDVTVRTAQPPTTSQACIKVGAALRRAEKEKRDYYTGFNHGKTLIVPAAMTTTGGFASSFVDLLGQLARCAEARGVYQPGLDEAFVPRWKGRFAALVHQMNADHIQRHFGGVCLRSS